METLTFSDIFKKSFLEAGGLMQGLNGEVLLQAMQYILLSVIIGVLLFILYRRTYSGVVYSRAFAVSILGMTVLTCAIIVTIQSNTVLSHGSALPVLGGGFGDRYRRRYVLDRAVCVCGDGGHIDRAQPHEGPPG